MTTFLELAQQLSLALRSLQMYQAAHPRSQDALAAAHAGLGAWLAEKPSLRFAVTNGKAFVDGHPFEESSPHLATLVKQVAERQVSGFLFERGVEPAELLELLQILLLKPQKIDAEGGFAKLLAARGVKRITVSQTQYKEIGPDGEQAEEKKAPEPEPAIVQPTDAEARLFALRETLMKLLSGPGLPPPGGQALSLSPAPLGAASEMDLLAGAMAALPPAQRLSGLSQLFKSLSPAVQLNLLASAGSLGDKHPELASALKSLVPDLLSSAVAGLMQQGYGWSQMEPSIRDILAPMKERLGAASALMAQFQAQGADEAGRSGLELLLRSMDWEDLSLESRVARLLEGDRLLELGADQRLAFLRDLLDKRMHEAFLRALDKLMGALRDESAERRRSLAQTLLGVSRWSVDPGLPEEAVRRLEAGLADPFVEENTQEVQRLLAEAFAEVLLRLAEYGELSHVAQRAEALAVGMLVGAEEQPWKAEEMARFEAELRVARAREAALQAVLDSERAHMDEFVVPFLLYQGPPMAERLVQRLEEEPDRTRRGRIMDGLKAMGPMAVEALVEALGSSTWYLVRNALTSLADVGSAALLPRILPLLRHPEPRVCRTAARTVWKLGAAAAEGPLLGVLRDAEPGTQLEILWALGQLRGAATAPALAAMASDRKLPDRLRLKLLETLAGLPSPQVVPAMLELARRRSFFQGSSEPLGMRVAAGRVLAAAGPEGRAALQKLVEAEPRGADREALAALLK